MRERLAFSLSVAVVLILFERKTTNFIVTVNCFSGYENGSMWSDVSGFLTNLCSSLPLMPKLLGLVHKPIKIYHWSGERCECRRWRGTQYMSDNRVIFVLMRLTMSLNGKETWINRIKFQNCAGWNGVLKLSVTITP